MLAVTSHGQWSFHRVRHLALAIASHGQLDFHRVMARCGVHLALSETAVLGRALEDRRWWREGGNSEREMELGDSDEGDGNGNEDDCTVLRDTNGKARRMDESKNWTRQYENYIERTYRSDEEVKLDVLIYPILNAGCGICARVVLRIFGRELLKNCHASNAPVMPNYKNRMPRLPINRDFFSNRYASRKISRKLSIPARFPTP